MEFIAAIVDRMLAVLAERVPDHLSTLTDFREYGKAFTGVVANWPAVWVMPVRTEFDGEGSGIARQAHLVQIKFGVSGNSPAAVTEAGMAYMKAIHAALAASWPGDWAGEIDGVQVLGLAVRNHEYGPLFERQAVMARFPEMEVVVVTAELWPAGQEGV